MSDGGSVYDEVDIIFLEGKEVRVRDTMTMCKMNI